MGHPFFFRENVVRFQKADLDIADMFDLPNDFFLDFYIDFKEEENVELNDIFEIVNYFMLY